jgi:TPP-dependent pyruvate/acetoin dehydrogenase alpha subunit
MHLIDTTAGVMGTSAVVGTTIPQAVGYAWAMTLRGMKRVVVNFFGDGAVEEGVWHESMNFAALKKLPVIFICENNLYSIHSHLSGRQPHANIWERARAHGIAAERIEHNDALRIYAQVKDAAEAIRAGHSGPWFFECLTYRWKEHVGPNDDFHAGYRSRGEAEPWFEQDQVKRLGELVARDVRQQIDREVLAEIRDAFQFAEDSPFPEADELYTDVFREIRDGALADLR